MPLIKNTQNLRIERREWYDTLQRNISPHFRPSRDDHVMISQLMKHEETPMAIKVFAAGCHTLTDYSYWFLLGTCWVQYTGWSELELWKELLSSSRPHRESCLMKPEERKHYRNLPKTVHCYRVHRPDEKDWLSFTLDYNTAVTYTKMRGVSQIHEYRVPRKKMLCLFLRRGEYEVLCLHKNAAELYRVHAVAGGE